MDDRALEVFLSVYRSLNYTQTAKERHMSVSAVSRSIARLEQELGRALFDRDRRGMRPTAAAESLRPLADQMLTDWRALKRVVQPGIELQGDVRLYCSVTATHRLLSPLLAAYRSTYPGVRVLLQTGDQADGIDHVLKGEADAAVVALPASLASQLSFQSITTSKLHLCLPPTSSEFWSGRQPIAKKRFSQALEGAPWILPERGVSRRLIDAWLEEEYDEPPNVYARVAGHEAIAAMVSLGLGVGVVPQLVVEASASAESLQVLDLGSRIPKLDVGVCVRSGRLSDPVIEGLWQVANEMKRDAS